LPNGDRPQEYVLFRAHRLRGRLAPLSVGVVRHTSAPAVFDDPLANMPAVPKFFRTRPV